jgi:hypothetical protein
MKKDRIVGYPIIASTVGLPQQGRNQGGGGFGGSNPPPPRIIELCVPQAAGVPVPAVGLVGLEGGWC